MLTRARSNQLASPRPRKITNEAYPAYVPTQSTTLRLNQKEGTQSRSTMAK